MRYIPVQTTSAIILHIQSVDIGICLEGGDYYHEIEYLYMYIYVQVMWYIKMLSDPINYKFSN